MKKLIALIGAVATAFGLYAADVVTDPKVGFETDDAGFSDPTAVDWEAAGWTGGTDGASVVGYEAAGVGTYVYGVETNARRIELGSGNANFLKLETGTNTLSHGVTQAGTVFFDQLVQFTGFEEAQTNLAAGTKIAVWLSAIEQEGTPAVPAQGELKIQEGVDEEGNPIMGDNPDYVPAVKASDDYIQGETNLYVTCGNDAGEQVAFKLDGNYQPDTWYRVTIKSLGDILPAPTAARLGFIVYIDGVQVKTSDEAAKSLIYAGTLDDLAKNYQAEGQLFPAIADGDTISSFGYCGIGKVDDVVADNRGPDFARLCDITLPSIDGAKITKITDAEGRVWENEEGLTGEFSVKKGNITVWLTAEDGWIVKMTSQPVSVSDDGEIEVDSTGVVEVFATVTNGDDTTPYAEADLYDMMGSLVDGDSVMFVKGADITNGVDDVNYYTVTDGTTIDVEDGAWSIYIDVTEEGSAGSFSIMADVTNDISIEGEEGSEIYFAANIAEGATVEIADDLYVSLEDDITVAGTFMVDTVDLSGQFALTSKGKVMSKTALTVEDAFTAPENIKEPTQEDDYYVYVLNGGVEFTLVAPANATITEVKDADGNVIEAVEDVYEADPDAKLTVTLTADDGYLFGDSKTTTEVITAAEGEITLKTEAPAKAGFAIIIAGEPVTTNYYESLDAAIAAADANDTVTLLSNATLTAPCDITKALTLDLNGFTLTGAADANWAIRMANVGPGVVIKNGTIAATKYGVRVEATGCTISGVTINSGMRAVQLTLGATVVVDGNSALTVNDTTRTKGEPGIFVTDASSLTIAAGSSLTANSNGGAITARDGGSAKSTVIVNGTVANTFIPGAGEAFECFAISGNGNDGTYGVDITIGNGAVVSSTSAPGIFYPCAGTLNIGAATITGTEAVYLKAGVTAIVSGATLTGNGPNKGYEGKSGTAETGDALVVANEGYPAGTAQITVSGGTFTSANGAAVASYAKEGFTRVTGFISGGSFKGTAAPAVDLINIGTGTDTAKWVLNGDFYEPFAFAAVAQIGDAGEKFESLAAAVAAAADGDTITLLADTTDAVVFAQAGEFMLDLNNFELTMKSGEQAAVKVDNADADVTITGGAITIPQGAGFCVWARQGDVIIVDGTFTNDDNDDYCVYAGGGTAPDFLASTVTILGGTFNNLSEEQYKWNPARMKLNLNTQNGNEDAVISVQGGTFSADPAQGDDSGTPASFVADGYVSTYDEATKRYSVAKSEEPVDNTEAQVVINETTTVTNLHDALVVGSAKDAVVTLLKDVDLTGKTWEPVANFAGTFDGKGFKISNLTITAESGDNQGFFANLGNDAVICNITIENVDVNAQNSQYVGGLIGGKLAQNGSVVSNVTVCGDINIVGYKYVGGIAGHIGYAYVSDCHVDGGDAATSFIGQASTKTAEGQVGGIWGMTGEGASYQLFDSSVKNVTLFGNERVGAIAGRIYGTKLVNCSAENVVIKNPEQKSTGMIAGTALSNGTSMLIDCEATNVTLEDGAGNPYDSVIIGSAAVNTAIGTDVEGDALAFGSSNFKFTAGTFTVADADALAGLTAQVAEGYKVVDNLDGTYTVMMDPVAMIDETGYPTLEAAFADAQANDTIKLVKNVVLGNKLTVNGFDGILDLNGYSITNAVAYTGGAKFLIDVVESDLTISNGTIFVTGNMVYARTNSVITIASDATINSEAGGGTPNTFRLYGDGATLNVYGTINKIGVEGGAIDQCVGSSIVNVYEGAKIKSNGYIFKVSVGAGNSPVVNVYGGEFETTAGGYAAIYAYNNNTATINLLGGDFIVPLVDNKDGKVFSIVQPDKQTVNGLGADSAVRFSRKSNVAEFCAEGYEPVLVDGWYVIKQLHTVTLKNGEDVIDTQVVADGLFATNVVLDVAGFKGWTNDTYTAAFDFATTEIKADITLFAWIEAALPIPTEDLPADIDPADAEVLETTAANLISSGVDAAALKAATAAAKAGTTLTADQQNIINSLLLQSNTLVEGAEVKAASIAIVNGKVTVTVEGVNCELPAKTTIGYLTVKHCETVGGDFKAVKRIEVTTEGVGTAAELDGSDAAGFYKAEFEWNKPEFEAQ